MVKKLSCGVGILKVGLLPPSSISSIKGSSLSASSSDCMFLMISGIESSPPSSSRKLILFDYFPSSYFALALAEINDL